MIGEAAGECPLKRCDGTLTVEGYGVDERARTVRWSICQTCGKTVEQVMPMVDEDHPTLFGGG